MNVIQQNSDGRGLTVPSRNDLNSAQAGNSCCGPSVEGRSSLGGFLPSWLGGSRGIILGAIVVVGAGLAFGWPTLVALGVAPLLLSVLPCAVMCGLGLCMMGKGGKSTPAQDSAAQAPIVDQAPNLIIPAPDVPARSDERVREDANSH